MLKDLLRIADLSTEDLVRLLDLADSIKREPYRFDRVLDDESLFAYFSKPSTRTRVSLAEAVARLGGQIQFFGPQELQLGRGETIEDTAAVVSRYAKVIVIRTYSDDELDRFAGAATVPVINALTDLHHPCQALADMMTIREKLGRIAGVRIVYVGAGNNVAHSLMEAGAMLGAEVVIATPAGLAPDPGITRVSQRMAATSGGSVTLSDRPLQAVAGADVIYTDVWTSMGDSEQHRESRLTALHPFQVNAELMSRARPHAIFMHCLPAHRGEEVTDEVLDGPQSVVLDQAENRLHTEQALLVALLEESLTGAAPS
ncbi:MAG: ornithine carbamoyltransferase [Acidimicrobiia bacterium]|nr:ornithine carbamoyltransferase [Acidimicrobiia bacterium]MDH4307159.1 ornithine carbamoyltransferase [Acidimicrobiia bacterium]MDH5292299.1 ornithine carbamoyltransferase [Acidimicrobiia bacterium]